MNAWTPPKWCTSRHPSIDNVTCERRNNHGDSHRAEIGPPLTVTVKDAAGNDTKVTRAQVVSW